MRIVLNRKKKTQWKLDNLLPRKNGMYTMYLLFFRGKRLKPDMKKEKKQEMIVFFLPCVKKGNLVNASKSSFYLHFNH